MTFRDMLKVKYYKKVFSLLKVVLIGKLIKKGKKLNAWKMYFLLQSMLKNKTKKSSNLIILIALLNSLIKIHFIKFRMGSVKKEIPIYLNFERQVKFTINSWFKYTFKGLMHNNLKGLVKLIGISFKNKGPVIRKNYQEYKKALDAKVFLRLLKK